MPERSIRKPVRRNFTEIPSTGREGKIWGYTVGRRQGDLIIKKLDTVDENIHGFPREEAKILRMHYAHLVAQYGDLIVKQKVMPTRYGRYFLAQERLRLADPADVFAYLPSNFPEAAKSQLEAIITQVNDGLFDAMGRPVRRYEHPVPLDLGPGNLLLTQDDRVRYVDTGFGILDYKVFADTESLHEELHCRLAELDLLRGRPVAEVLRDPLYIYVKRMAQRLNPLAFARGQTDADTLKQLYDDVFIKSPLRGYLDPDRVSR